VTKKLNDRPMWAITGAYGLYAGTFFTRRDAITYHAWACHTQTDGHIASEYAPMSDAHRKSWARCRRNGDRCVKVNIHAAS